MMGAVPNRDTTDCRSRADEFRDMSALVMVVREEERARVARELHDDVTQRLALLSIDLGLAELAAPDGPQSEMMRRVRQELRRLSADIHSLAHHLHPSVLEDLGLAEALRSECERRGRQGEIDISLDLGPLPPVVAKDAELCLYRVAQEALNNAARHAGSGAARVVLQPIDGGLRLTVRDDGVGFDSKSPKTGRSLGLASMRERVRLVNGTFDIDSAPGRGTAITAWVPAGS
jgi:signal transduction histidine kinase